MGIAASDRRCDQGLRVAPHARRQLVSGLLDDAYLVAQPQTQAGAAYLATGRNQAHAAGGLDFIHTGKVTHLPCQQPQFTLANLGPTGHVDLVIAQRLDTIARQMDGQRRPGIHRQRPGARLQSQAQTLCLYPGRAGHTGECDPQEQRPEGMTASDKIERQGRCGWIDARADVRHVVALDVGWPGDRQADPLPPASDSNPARPW